MSTVTTPTFQGRFGFHPCSYEDFVALKRLHKLTLRAYRQFREHQRWERKEPQNRVFRDPVRSANGQVIGHTVRPRPEPPKCPEFLVDRFGRFSLVPGSTKPYTYQQLLEEYRKARYPRPAESVQPLDLPVEWRSILERLEQSYADASH